MPTSGLEFRYLGRRHVLVPSTDSHEPPPGEKWTRVADDQASAIIRFGLRRARARLDSRRMRSLWLSMTNASYGFFSSDHELVDAIVRAAEQHKLVLFREPGKAGSGGGVAPPPPGPKPPPPPGPKPPPSPPPKAKKVVSIEWNDAEVWCSDDAHFHGVTTNFADGEALDVTAQEQGGAAHKVPVKISGDAFASLWSVKDVLPPKAGGHFVKELNVDAKAGGQTSPKPLKLRFIPSLAKVPHTEDKHTWKISVEDFLLKVEAEIKFVPGWAGQVVKLGNKAPAGTGGLLDGQLTWDGYRWMKNVGVGKQFWDGTAWQNLPAGFVLADANNFSVGFYKTGATFTCQYGGTWPENFTAWSIDAAANQTRLRAWESNIDTTWTGKFDLKRKECKSAAKTCCRYPIKVTSKFAKEAAFGAGVLIVADGNIRSNDSLFFLGEPRLAMAAHEFGHHLGNPDEYAGAAVDATMNGDGAVNGIDADSIMGQNLTKVKVRHLKVLAKVFGDAVKAEYGKTFTYDPVKP